MAITMKTKAQRINNIIGQLEGIKKMIDNRGDCLSILTQLKAVKSAIGSVMDSVVEEQFDNCLKSLSRKDKVLFKKMKSYVGAN
jgi:DNA-binding FrmR family transcriptional regulator